MALEPHEGYVGGLGGRTWYRVIGDGGGEAPLVMLHGGPGAAWADGLDAVELLARDRPVVLYDQLGSGRSDDPADPSRWTVDAFVEELTSLRRHLGLSDAHLYGWSWGGTLAVASALADPTWVRSLVLASPVVNVPFWNREGRRLRDGLPPATVRALRRYEDRYRPGPPDAGKPRLGRSSEELVRTGRRMHRAFPLLASRPVQLLARAASRFPPLRAASYQLLSLQFMRRHVLRSDPVPPAIFTMLAGMNGRLYRAMWGPAEYLCVGTLAGVDLTDRLSALSCPVLLTSGRHDEATPMQMQEIVDHVRDGRWIVFEESAHSAILEEPLPYADAVASFLAEVDGRRA